MSIQEWFDKRKEAQIERRNREARMEADSTPSLWVKCVHCETQLTKKELEITSQNLEQTKQKLSQLQSSLDNATIKYNRDQIEMGKRLREIYKGERISFLSLYSSNE